MKRIFLSFLFILSSFGVAQCPEGNVFLLCQEDLDQFAIDYPNCTEVLGDLIIQSEPNPGGETPITNLQGLLNIEKVHGNVVVKWCYYLPSLEGLNSLKSIDGEFYISQNGIVSINNIFSVLESVGGSLTFHANEDLILIDDFNSILSIGGYMNLQQNDNLLSIDGFENLENISGFLRIADHKINHISGFQNLSYIGGDFNLSSNFLSFEPLSISSFDSLTTISGNLIIIQTTIEDLNWLNNLNSIGGEILINGNSFFTDASGIANLTSMNGGLKVMQNMINSLDGFHNIEPSNINYLNLNYNPSLSDCSKPNICQYLLNGGEYIIQYNNSGCNSAEEILMNCDMSTSEEGLNDKVAVFPNPAKDKLHIQSNNLILQEMGLYSTEGRLLQKYNPKEKILDVTKYPSGNYVLVIKTDKGKISKKILITK